MGSDHSLGRSGGARGENRIERDILVQMLRGAANRVRTPRRLQQLLQHVYLSVEIQRPRRLQVGAVRDHVLRARHRQDTVEPAHGQRGVHRNIKTSGHRRSQKSHRGQHVASGHHNDSGAGLRVPDQKACRRQSQVRDLREGQGAFPVGINGFVPVRRQRLSEIIKR